MWTQPFVCYTTKTLAITLKNNVCWNGNQNTTIFINMFGNVCKMEDIWFWCWWLKWNFFADIAHCVNTLRPRQNGRHFAEDIFKYIFLNENVWVPIKISLKVVPKGRINNIPALVQIMAWRRPGDKPLSEPMMVSLPTHICVTRPQWVKDVWVVISAFLFQTHRFIPMVYLDSPLIYLALPKYLFRKTESSANMRRYKSYLKISGID